MFSGGIALVLLLAFALWLGRHDIALQGAQRYLHTEFARVERVHNGAPLSAPLKIKAGEREEIISLGDYAGQIVLLNLWASWCAPCVAELPELQALKEYYGVQGGELAVLAVSVDHRKTMPEIAEFLARHDVSDAALYHDFRGDLQLALPFTSLPTSFLIGRDGRVLYKMTGKAHWTDKRMLKFLDVAQKVY